MHRFCQSKCKVQRAQRTFDIVRDNRKKFVLHVVHFFQAECSVFLFPSCELDFNLKSFFFFLLTEELEFFSMSVFLFQCSPPVTECEGDKQHLKDTSRHQSCIIRAKWPGIKPTLLIVKMIGSN